MTHREVDRRRHVVIIGGGFGGLSAARALSRRPVHVTLIDRKNHHTFQPLLYQVATTMLSPGQIASPIRAILRHQANVEVLLAEVTGIDLAAHRVALDASEVSYDYLIVSTGAGNSYFGHAEWEALAPSLKSVEDALEIRRRVLLAFELAERDATLVGGGAPPEGGDRPEPITLVVIGGGPTGVELAGALADLARRALAKDFRAIDPGRARIVVLEAGARILPTFPEDLSRAAQAALTRLGVEVRTSTAVTGIEPGLVRTGDTALPAAITLWAAGVAASPVGRLLGSRVDRAGRVAVERDLSVPGHPEVFAVGDLALCIPENGEPLPGLAAVAVEQGKAAADNIWRAVSGRPLIPFRYVNKGTLATIGRKAAVADFGRIHLSGFVGWLVWLFVHILMLVGFRNRVMVLLEWSWAFLTQERSSRLITGSSSLPGWHTAKRI